MNREYIIIGGIALAGGFLGGFLVGKKLTETKYEKILTKEIDDAKRFYTKLSKRDTYSDVVDVVRSYGGHIINDPSTNGTEDGSDFIDKVDNFDYPSEIASRSSDEPYIIHEDEFYEEDEDLNFTKTNMTFFEEDDILLDDGDVPVQDVDGVVGLSNLDHFGYGSSDKDSVYIRNENLMMDFEVIRSKGNFAKDILGYIEHSDNSGRPRKFRRGYE